MEDLLVDYLTVDLVQQAAVGHDLLQRICDEMDNPEQNYSMQDLIESLEPSLTSNDDKERWKATFLLAEIFGKKEFASDVLTSSVLHLFLIFFCRRCTDFPSITPSLQAISSILRKYHGLLDGKYCDILDIVLTIVKEIHIPSYAQNIRQLAMEILSFIFQHEGISKQLTANAMEVVDGVINTMEEEKDPRCLVLALQLLAKVSKTFPEVLEDSITTQLQVDSDYETLAEKLFDNTSCYFPISFSPPPDDPFGITTEDLVEALEAAMCASIPIIKFSIPFFIEQINSEQVSARIYALHGLLNIVQEFGHVVFRQRAIDHRSGRMSELLAGENEEHKPYLLRLSQLVFDVACVEASNEILEQVYRLVGGITYSIGKDVVGKYASDWQTFHGYILSKVHNEVLKSPTSIDSLKMKAMWKLTLSIGSAGGCFTAAIIVKQFMPILLERVQRSLHMTQLHLQRYLQASLQNVKILTSFTNEERIVPSSIQMLESLVTCALPLSMDVTAMEDLNPLKEYQDAIFEALTGFVLNIRNLTFAATATTTAMVSEEEEVKTNKLEGDISLALMMSMHAMAEWFLRSKGQAMQPQKVTAYLHLMIEIAIQGFPALLSFLDSSMVAAVESRLSLNDENNMLQSAAGDLFVKLINLQTNKEGLIDFQGIILTSCLPRLLQSIVQIPTADQVASADFCSSHSKRCQLLTKLIIANTNASIWSQVLESLIPAIVNCVQTLASHGTDEVAAKTALFVLQQWLDIFVNVLPRETTGDALKSLQIKIIHLVGCKEGVALDLKTSPLLTLAQAVFALPVGWEGKKDIQAKLLAIQHSFHTLLSIAMSYLSVSQQDVFYQTFFATFPDSFAQQVTRPDHFGGAEVLLALLCHYDKQGQCFQASTSSNSCSLYTGFQLANVIMNRLKMSSSASSDREVEAEAKCFSVIVNKVSLIHALRSLLY